MILVSVLYPHHDGAKFDKDYYLNKHMKRVHECWDGMGLKMARVLHGETGPDGAPPLYTVMTHLGFDSSETFEAAAKRHGEELFGDVPNFTDIQPVVQVSTVLA